jgi:hypothetical protein
VGTPHPDVISAQKLIQIELECPFFIALKNKGNLMFTLVFINPTKSLSTTVMVEGYPVVVEMSLPSDIISYECSR